MKKQVRIGVFESNSSNTHSITIVKADDFDKWKNGELMFDRWNQEFVESAQTKIEEEDVRDYYNDNKEKYWKDWEQLDSYEKEEWFEDYARENGDPDEQCMSYERYMDYYNNYQETYIERFITPSNDKMVAFGYYGHD